MQPTQLSRLPGDQSEEFLERLTRNRLILQDRVARMSSVLNETAEARRRIADLRLEARRRLDDLTEGRAQWRGTRLPGPRPVLPRYSPARPDPLDAVRRQLHETYAVTRDPALRAELVASYDGFARSLALKYRHREALDDLMQVARIGLLHAIDRFDPALGRPFPLFARITITGELKRHIRDKTWGMRVPRSLQEDYLNVMRAVDELTAEHSDSPSMEALAARCGMSV